MSLGLVIAAPDAAEKFGGRLEDNRIPSRADLEGQSLYKRTQAPGGQREASTCNRIGLNEKNIWIKAFTHSLLMNLCDCVTMYARLRDVTNLPFPQLRAVLEGPFVAD